jgi:hypothetical protein
MAMEGWKLDVYGQCVVHVERVEGGWRVMRGGPEGGRALLGVEVPQDLPASELARCLDDVLYESAGPGATITLMEQ